LITGPLTVRIRATDTESGAGTLDVDYRIDNGFWTAATYNMFTGQYENTVDSASLSDGTHTITARATDGYGNTSTSAAISFNVDNNEPPTVTISSPTANATVDGTITIRASASDDVAVDSVEFFVDGASVGTDTSSAGGWTASWDTTGVPSGRHVLTAIATDAPGKTGTSPAVSFTVDQPPTVDITRPRSLQRVEERITITATADDDFAVEQVEFFVDGVRIGTDTTAGGGWSVSWNSRNVNNGRRTIRAVATDSDGQTSSDSIVITVDNDLAPSITITAPRNGATIYAVGIVLISANATDNEPVTQVEFFIDGVSIGVDTVGSNGWSAVWNATRATIGPHTVRAVATDSIGQTSTDSNEITVQSFVTPTTQPPTTTTTLEVLGQVIEANTPAQNLSALAFSLSPPTVSAGGEIFLDVTLAASIPGTAELHFLLDGQPLGETEELTAANGLGTSVSFTRTLPTGMQAGLHRIELVTAEDPPEVLASRTIGVVAGALPDNGDDITEAGPEPEETRNPAGLIVAIVIGSVAAAIAAGFGAAGWYRRKMIVRRLAGR
jgi:hypothetical protein